MPRTRRRITSTRGRPASSDSGWRTASCTGNRVPVSMSTVTDLSTPPMAGSGSGRGSSGWSSSNPLDEASFPTSKRTRAPRRTGCRSRARSWPTLARSSRSTRIPNRPFARSSQRPWRSHPACPSPVPRGVGAQGPVDPRPHPAGRGRSGGRARGGGGGGGEGGGFVTVDIERALAADPVSRLDVSVLHREILQRELGLKPDELESERYLSYSRDVATLLDRVETGAGQAAFLLRPPAVSDVVEVARAGQVMPQKSTYFFPKPASGIVFNPLSSSIRIGVT